MTPSCPHRVSGVHRHRLAIRRSAAVLVAALAIGGAPLVARALESGSVSAVAVPGGRGSEAVAQSLGGPLVSVPTRADVPGDPRAEIEPVPPSQTPLEAVTRVLTRNYTWDERGDRVSQLQFLLGLRIDGWYSAATLAAHRSALEVAGLPVDVLPAKPIPAGPAPEKWAALRECESGGDYGITNPSGKYRGAYQFDRSTWNSVAERHDPSLVGVDPAAASPADQDAMAMALYSERGARPWPHCGRHLR